MYRHDFHSVGECGHKRNFTYYHGKKAKLKSIRAECHICDKPIKFTVVKYLSPVIDVSIYEKENTDEENKTQ